MKPQLKLWLVLFAVTGVVIWQLPKEEEEVQSLQHVLSSVQGVGKVELYYETQKTNALFVTNDTASTGMLIVCEGCQSERVERMIVETVSAVMDIPPHQIKVLPLEEKER